MRWYKIVIISLILGTTLPFALLFANVDAALFISTPTAFWREVAVVSGHVTGFAGAVLLMWQLVLGIRTIIKPLTRDGIWLNKTHRWIGTYAVVFIFAHPFLQMYAYVEDVAWVVMADFSSTLAQHISFGRVAFFLLLIIWVTSALLRGRMKYRPWLYTHYLAYVLVAFVLIHPREIGTYLGRYPVLSALWNVLITAYLLIVVYRIAVFAGVGKRRFKLIGTEAVGERVTLYTFSQAANKIVPRVGQHVYLQLRPFGETHPFTVMEHDAISGRITVGVKTLGRFTNKMQSLQVGDRVLVDGPYGVFTEEAHNAKPKVLIAGGIGITPFVDLVKQYGNEATILLHANRSLEDVVRREDLIEKLGGNYQDFLSQSSVQGLHITHGRLDEEAIKNTVGHTAIKTANFFVCGSPGFIKGMRSALATLGISRERIFCEELGF